MKLIDKDALVAEIERRRKDWRYGSSVEAKYKIEECDDILSFLDTLETKEADLEKAMTTQIVYLVIAIVVLTLGLAFVGIRGDQMEDRIVHFELLYKNQRNISKLYVEHTKIIYNKLSKCSEEIERLKKDLSVLEGVQSKMDIKLSKIDVLETKLNGLEWLINNLNAFHPVRYEPNVADKPYDPLNPSGIIYNTNTTESEK